MADYDSGMIVESCTAAGKLARNVRRFRERRGLSQQALAAILDWAQPRISEIESGRFRPRLATIERLAAALGVAPFELLR